jgi:hypothetical protein
VYIHVGSRVIVSDADIVGIFNVRTLRMSDDNRAFLENAGARHKSVIVRADTGLLYSIVSPYTIIKRTRMNMLSEQEQ